MAETSIILQNENALHTSYDTSKIFVGNNRFIQESITAAADLAVGTVLDRVTATGVLSPLNSATAANNKIPVGILAQPVANGETKTVNICIDGDVVEDKIVLGGTDTLATVISGRKIKDLIAGQTAGIKIVPYIELSSADNS